MIFISLSIFWSNTPFFKNLFLSNSFAAYGLPSNFEVTLYTTAKAPLPMVPTLLYFPAPSHSLAIVSAPSFAVDRSATL